MLVFAGFSYNKVSWLHLCLHLSNTKWTLDYFEWKGTRVSFAHVILSSSCWSITMLQELPGSKGIKSPFSKIFLLACHHRYRIWEQRSLLFKANNFVKFFASLCYWTGSSPEFLSSLLSPAGPLNISFSRCDVFSFLSPLLIDMYASYWILG